MLTADILLATMRLSGVTRLDLRGREYPEPHYRVYSTRPNFHWRVVNWKTFSDHTFSDQELNQFLAQHPELELTQC